MLGADFSADRERPSSPSPLAENKPIVPATEEETKPKEWRQKIESWLQANEQDSLTDEVRRQRRITNRRSFEMDSGKIVQISSFQPFKSRLNIGMSIFKKKLTSLKLVL